MPPTPDPRRTGLARLRGEGRFGARFVRRHGGRLLLLFCGALIPLWVFSRLADGVAGPVPFPFDEPLLQWARTWQGEPLDTMFLLLSALGYQWGVVPVDVALVAVLAWTRRMREGLFAGVALAGSALLNLAAKQLFARERPSLWESIAPETTYSFPSGHAMGAMTLTWVVVLLAWHTRWRWVAIVAMCAFTSGVAASRVYLGVHYPSDILAGWAAASAWVVSVYLLVFRPGLRPWWGGSRGVPGG